MFESLMTAVRAGDERAVLSLVEANPGLLAQRDADGVSALTLAAYLGRAGLVAALRAQRGEPDLWEACIVGDNAAVSAALAAGQKVEDLAPDGFTPLGLAVFFRQPQTARLLLDAGANPSNRARNALGVGPVHAAVAR